MASPAVLRDLLSRAAKIGEMRGIFDWGFKAVFDFTDLKHLPLRI
jgi:hypothetical protein